jgi:hypothetical protein
MTSAHVSERALQFKCLSRFHTDSVKGVCFERKLYIGLNVIIIWGIANCSPYVNRRFGGTRHLLTLLKTFVLSENCMLD